MTPELLDKIAEIKRLAIDIADRDPDEFSLYEIIAICEQIEMDYYKIEKRLKREMVIFNESKIK